MNITQEYSGVAISQNVAPGANDKVVFTSETEFYQEFLLPQDYTRGENADEQIIPPLTGFHLLVKVEPGTENQIGFDWTIDHYIIGSGWTTLPSGSGTVLGAPASGEKVWVEAIAANPIEIPSSLVESRFRIGVTSHIPVQTPLVNQPIDYDASTRTLSWDGYILQNFTVTPGVRQKANLRNQLGYVYQEGVGDQVYFTEAICPTSIWYSSPNPLENSHVSALNASDTALPYSFLFRILGLVADSGTDFLGNEYRSAVQIYEAKNTDTVDGADEDKIWMSKPNPSRFAVESIYYDIRKKMPETYGAVNLIKNPNGESGGDFWFDHTAGTPATTSTAWKAQGSQSIRMNGTTASGTNYVGFAYQGNDATNWMRVKGGKKYSFSAQYNIVTLPASATNHYVLIRYADVTGSYLSEDTLIIPTATTTEGVKSVSLAGFTAPGAAYYATVIISVQTGTAGQLFDFMLDRVLFAESPTEAVNLIKNPSGESGADLWYDMGSGLVASSSSAWAVEGTKSIQISGTTGGGTTYPGIIYQGDDATNWAEVSGGQKYSCGASVNIAAIPASSTYSFIYVRYADVTGAYLTGQDTQVSVVAAATGTRTVSMRGFTVPSSAHYATVMFFIDSTVGSQAYDLSIDQVSLTEDAAYFDGNSVGYYWEDAPNLSASVPVPSPTIDDSPMVVDKVLIDPITPGVFFHVYYSDEGVAGKSEAEWENKLWTRVNGTFQANKRETHALPYPITAKFIKIEFSHLQARSYNPGDQPRPTAYKKHPRWVLEYFMARTNSKNALEARLMNKRVGVVFDGYDLGFNYYLDDINQEPDQPAEIALRSDDLDSFLRDDNFADRIDPDTMSRINLAFEPYKSHISTWFGRNSLGDVLNATIDGTTNYPVEENYGGDTRGSFRNPEVAYENDIPAMFFFVTCRHKYRESLASFSHNRAYFVGIRQISFSRENYTERFDTDHYIEPAGDLLNIERNDFATINGRAVVTGGIPIRTTYYN